MAWTFEIPTGKWFDPLGNYMSTGYAGHGAGFDNVADESIADVGPIPEGAFQMGKWFDDPEKGKIVCHLTPLPGTNTYGRSGFMIHGDSIQHPGQASHGCPIADKPSRTRMSLSPDQILNAVREFNPLGAQNSSPDTSSGSMV
jgi:hypothetical protein